MADFEPEMDAEMDDVDEMEDEDAGDEIELLEAPDEGNEAPKENVERVTTRCVRRRSEPRGRGSGVVERRAAGT